jgi:hypothetical protein
MDATIAARARRTAVRARSGSAPARIEGMLSDPVPTTCAGDDSGKNIGVCTTRLEQRAAGSSSASYSGFTNTFERRW